LPTTTDTAHCRDSCSSEAGVWLAIESIGCKRKRSFPDSLIDQLTVADVENAAAHAAGKVRGGEDGRIADVLERRGPPEQLSPLDISTIFSRPSKLSGIDSGTFDRERHERSPCGPSSTASCRRIVLIASKATCVPPRQWLRIGPLRSPGPAKARITPERRGIIPSRRTRERGQR
jgi:hypothetical protein